MLYNIIHYYIIIYNIIISARDLDLDLESAFRIRYSYREFDLDFL
jgi:hypothetical protein